MSCFAWSRSHRVRAVVAACGAILLLAACGSPPPRPVDRSPAGASTPPLRAPVMVEADPIQTQDWLSDDASAEPLDWTQPVSLAAIVARIRARHPEAAGARAAVAAAAAAVLQARAWENPEIAVSAGLTRSRSDGVDDDTPYGVSVTQPFGAWGVRRARSAAALAGVTAAEAEAELALLDLDRTAAHAVLRVLAEGEALTVTEAHLGLAHELVTASERLVAAGELAQADLARARAALAQAQASRAAQVGIVATARAQLRRLLGEDLPKELQLTGVWVNGSDLTESRADLDAEHPQRRAAEARLAAARHAEAAERAARGPSWSVGVEAERDDEQDEFTLTLAVSLPLWQGNAGGIAAARADRARAAAEAAAMVLRLDQDTAEVRAALAQAVAEAQALNDTVLPAAREALRLQRLAFEAGAADLPAVLDSQRAVLEVESQALVSRRRAAEAQIELRAVQAGFATATQP